MKINSILGSFTLLIFSSLTLFTACSKDEATDIPSATDPYPYPDEYTANKDLSMQPGDSFFDYCNGTWLKNNPVPQDPAKNLGGLYAARLYDRHLGRDGGGAVVKRRGANGAVA
jgi:hypothetical protein